MTKRYIRIIYPFVTLVIFILCNYLSVYFDNIKSQSFDGIYMLVQVIPFFILGISLVVDTYLFLNYEYSIKLIMMERIIIILFIIIINIFFATYLISWNIVSTWWFNGCGLIIGYEFSNLIIPLINKKKILKIK